MSSRRPPKPIRDSLPGAVRGPVVERSAGGVVVRTLNGNLHVLLIRDPYRKWGLPKGHLEDGEGAADAAPSEHLTHWERDGNGGEACLAVPRTCGDR